MDDRSAGRNDEPHRDDGTGGTERIAWRPSPAHIERSRLKRFMDQHRLRDYDHLLLRSTEVPEWFWDAVVKDLDLEFYTPYRRVVDTSQGMPWARWFVGGQFNYVHNALDKHAHSVLRNRLALIWEGEEGESRKHSYWELYRETNRLANALKSLGIQKGDRVGIFMPMVPETVIASLACSKIGAVFVPVFSGFGAPAAASRLSDCDARLLITADGLYRRGQVVPLKEVADEAAGLSPSVERLLVLRRTGRQVPWQEGRDLWWHEVVEGQSRECETERTDPEDPYMVIYTSGTTGKPKGAVHAHCGFPIKAAQDMAHCFDLQGNDILFWFTDLGWMMGPWAIAGALTLGSTLFIYDGAPDYPRPDRLWDMVERHGITVLGLSPTLVRGLMRHGEEWAGGRDLSPLRVLGSTGEPWDPESWWWFFRNAGGGRCPIINYTGGTEISGGILGCTVIQPQKPCSFTGPVPGMDVDVLDEDGQPVRGQVGELVIRKPWVGMTRGFWRDRERYLETYWSRWPDTWVHGDWAKVDEDGFWYILGRSDDTMKVAGKRLGPAEVESAVRAHPAVADAAAIGVPDAVKGEAIVCFAVLGPGIEPSERLGEEIEQTVIHHLGRALRPKAVQFVRDLPRTRNGKIMRRVIRARHLGLDLGDLSSLENPSALDEIRRAPTA
jgi:acetyl-CoA synthetase